MPRNFRLRPRFADFWLAALCAVLLAYTALGTGVSLLKDAATGCHIRTGDFILDHGAVPYADFLTFSREGQPWFAWEWLADLGMALLHRAAGLPGLAAVTAVIIAATFFLLARHALALGAGGLAALLAAQLAFAAASVHFLARPHILTFLFLAIASFWLRRDDIPWWRLPALTVVWVNVHAGFIALLISLALLGAGALLERRRDLFLRYAKTGLLCLAASLVNPYGWAEHRHILEFLTQGWVRGFVEEHASLRLDSPVSGYAVLLGAATLWVLFRGPRLYAPLLVGWAVASVRSVRNVPIWALLLAPLLAAELSRYWREGRTMKKLDADYRGPMSAVSAGAMVAALLLPFLLAWTLPGLSFPPSTAPLAFVAAESVRLAPRRLFTLDSWADYVSYRLYPRSRVFVDGRTDLFGRHLLMEYREALKGDLTVLDRHAVEAVLIPPGVPLATQLRAAPGWRVEIEHDGAVLFSRYDGARESYATDRRAAVPSPARR